MDELLALMEDDAAPCRDDTGSNNNGDDDSLPPPEMIAGGVDELATLMENDDIPSEANDPQAPPAYSRYSATVATKSSSRHNATKNSYSTTTSNPVNVGVDDRLGIRMINRNMSSLDLQDFITTNPYHSPAQIAAMSLHSLCQLLVDPPPTIIDPATVTGKTHFCTVGIVLEHSGTKSSSKGGSAFCVLTIGTFASGPCLSIFLFGSAYTQYCRSCRVGEVVAVLNPKLLPIREKSSSSKSDTSVSVTIYHPSQLVHVAKARDFGTCKALVKARQPDGTWRSNAGTCKIYIHKRQGDYCAKHRQQLQQQQQHAPSALKGAGGIATRVANGSKTKPNLVQQHKSQQQARTTTPLVVTNHSISSRAVVTPPPQIQNRFTNGGGIGATYSNAMIANNVPRHIKRERTEGTGTTRQTSLISKSNPSNSLLNGTRKPLRNTQSASTSSASSTTATGTAPISMPKRKATGIVGTGDWMKDATQQQRRPPTSLAQYAAKKNRRSLNTAGMAFNGSVPVPQPSKLFAAAPMTTTTTVSTIQQQNHALLQEEPDEDKIKLQQSILAEQRRAKMALSQITPKNGVGPGSSNKSTTSTKSKASSSSSSGNAFLDSIQVDNVEEVLNAKSRFASEANAEEYARNRRRVVELENLEFKKEKSKTAKEKEEALRMTKQWICRTCQGQPTFSAKPTRCIASGHNVKTIRNLKQVTTKEDERTKLNKASVENGGLVLGKGLDWSHLPYSRFS